MIRIKILKTGEEVSGFRITGHADYSEKGSDIVCSAVTILAYTAVNSCDYYKKEPKDIDFSDDGKTMELRVLNLNRDISVILNSFIIGIETLLYNYGDYINLEN